MVYDALKSKTLQAKKLPETLRFTGVSATVVNYIYTEILESIEHQRFYMPRRITIAQATLFTIKVESTQVFIFTHCKYNAQHVKCFKFANKGEAEKVKEAIRSAVNQVGLGFAPYKYEKGMMQIFIELKESMI